MKTILRLKIVQTRRMVLALFCTRSPFLSKSLGRRVRANWDHLLFVVLGSFLVSVVHILTSVSEKRDSPPFSSVGFYSNVKTSMSLYFRFPKCVVRDANVMSKLQSVYVFFAF
ncbi:hypothetical protein KSP39_PZI023765 [Platanthera zijinensis]|uniref:Transmembrane protein n=1 Tax=Platanthera zijinensis TaxID=2320716 RepID=A0AAP0ASN3_9ASPA